MNSRRTALVHDWLDAWGGAESVTAAMLVALSNPTLHALFDHLSPALRRRMGVEHVKTTFLQNIPGLRSRFWYGLPLMPLAIEQLDLRGFDTVVSSSHAFAKGVLTTADQLHVSYVHSPMRYAWDLHHDYLADYGMDQGLKSWLARLMFHRLRQWDRQTANNVDLFLANSENVARRIWKTYRRRSIVLYPPVDLSRFSVSAVRDDYFVSVSRLVSYKRVDIAVEAFNRMPEKRLLVIGDGPELAKLKALARPNVEFLGYQPDAIVAEHLARARALVFAANEDFGITPVEAQAAGTPVVALRRGGAVETVLDAASHPQGTGVFFAQQSAEALLSVIRESESLIDGISSAHCRSNAERFSAQVFDTRFRQLMNTAEAAWDGTSRSRHTFEAQILRND